MSRWVTTIFTTSLVLMGSQQLCGWGHPGANQDNTPGASQMPSSSFPLNEHQDWYVRESYLLWHPHEDDIDWADKSDSNSSDSNVSVRIKKPDFGWYSGARLGIGRYLPNHDKWDVALISTYFYADTKDLVHAQTDRGKSLVSTWSPFVPTVSYTEGQSVWRLNFFTWDLILGRNINFTSKITAHPFFALRSFLIYEEQSARYSNDESLAAKFRGYNDSWGIGPRLGSDFTLYLNKFWTLLGSLSGSVFLGSYNVGEKINTTSGVRAHTFHVSDEGYAVRSNLEGSLGMGWEKWVSRNRVRIAPSIMFEAAQWFDMNQWIHVGSTLASASQLSYYGTSRAHGDLTFFGFTFNLQVDF